METRVEQIVQQISGVQAWLMNKERTLQQTSGNSGVTNDRRTDSATGRGNGVFVLFPSRSVARLGDDIPVLFAFCPCTCGTECLKAHRSPLKHSLPLAIHQHGVSLLLLSLTRRCFAPLAAEVRTRFGSSGGRRNLCFKSSRKLSSSTSGGRPSSSSRCQRASTRTRFLIALCAARTETPF